MRPLIFALTAAFVVGCTAGAATVPEAKPDFRSLGLGLAVERSFEPGSAFSRSFDTRGLYLGEVVAPEPAPVPTPEPCETRDTLAAGLRAAHEEVPVWHGLVAGRLVEVYMSGTGTWSLVLSEPAGCAWLIEAGDGGQYVLLIGERA